jgi:hypothetical protein
MDGDFVLNLADELLDANIKLKLRRLELTAKDPEQIKSLTEQLAMPLDKALDILRDSDNVISLEIKLAGRLNELQVDSRQVLNKALGNSMKYAVISYAKYAIQPFGMLATASEVLGMLVAVRFEPLIFEPGASELSELHRNYLDKVSEMLSKKPKMVLSLCGVTALDESEVLGVGAVPAEGVEQESLDPLVRGALRALATTRGESAKRYLVEQKKIDQSRIFVCHPKLDGGKRAEGRVEVLL